MLYYTYEVFDETKSPYLHSGSFDTMKAAMEDIVLALGVVPVRHYAILKVNTGINPDSMSREAIARTTKVEDIYKGRLITVSLDPRELP